MLKKYLWNSIACCILAVASLLAGCTSLNLPTVSHAPFRQQSWQQRRLALSQIHRWNIVGAFSVRQARKSAIASYSWQQRNNTYTIRIHSSLDIYTATIAGRPGYVVLQRSNAQRATAANPEQLMQQQFGWRLPISNLLYWMRGLPAPGKYHAKFDKYGHLIYLQQATWRVSLSNYIPIGRVDLPRTLQLNYKGVAVKIVIKHWTL